VANSELGRPTWLSQLVGASVARPRRTLGLWFLVLAITAPAVGSLEIETSTESVLDRTDPAWTFYQESLRRFGGDEVVVVALPCAEAFCPELLGALGDLDEALAAIPGVRRVDSLANVPFVDSRPDGSLDLRPFVVQDASAEANVTRLRRSLEVDRIAPRTLISSGGRTLALNVVLERDLEIPLEEITRRIRSAVAPRKAWISGVPIFRTEVNTRTGSEIAIFVGVTVAIIAILVRLWFHSTLAVLTALGGGAAGSWLLAAAMSASGQPMMLGTMILPSLTLAFGCAYSMHLLATVRGVSHQGELAQRASRVALPILVSGVTTAIGFLGIAAVRIDAVQAVGVFGAIGVLAVVAFTITAGPALLGLRGLPAGNATSTRVAETVAASVVSLVRRHRGAIVAVWVLGGVISIYGVRALEAETDAVLWFTPDSEIRQSYNAIRRELAGISPVNVVVEPTNGEPVTTPETIAALDALASHLEELGSVGRAISVADPLRQINGGFEGDSEQRLPVSYAAIEQQLLLLESVPQLDDLITPDRTSANVQLRVDNNGSRHLLGVAEEAETWWREHGPPGTQARATGIMFEFARAQDEITRGQARGLVLALVCIGAVFLVLYRSPALVATALVPNVIPILMIFGIMGLLGVPLDAGTVVLGSLALGIAVDDTVHLITAYREQRELSGSTGANLEAALREVLVPVSYTTIAISLGFGVLALSDFLFTRNLGILTAGVMVICFAANVLLLPAILVRVRLRRPQGRSSRS